MPDYHQISSHLRHYERQVERAFAGAVPGALGAAAAAAPNVERSYFICFTNRSGSTLLAQALVRTRRMGRPGEMFNPEPIEKAVAERGIGSMEQYLDWRLAQAAPKGRVFGAKAGVHQLAWLAAQGFLERRFADAKYIYVTRRDLVMQAVSLFIASRSGVWSSRLGDAPAVAYDAKGIALCLDSLVRAQAEFEALFAALAIEPLRLQYEDIEQDLTRSMRRVCRHVGIERPGAIPLPKIALQRQRTTVNDEYAERFRAQHPLAPS